MLVFLIEVLALVFCEKRNFMPQGSVLTFVFGLLLSVYCCHDKYGYFVVFLLTII